MTSGILRKIVFPFQKPYNKETRYVWGDAPFSEIVLTLKPNCHFSHYSAVRIHGLTANNSPRPLTSTSNRCFPSNATGELSQKNIDIAFKRKVRTTSYIAETDEFRVCILNGKNTGYIGVVDDFTPQEAHERSHPTAATGATRVTNLERTLIDIAVRPVYSGGVHEVLKAYRMAQSALSVNRLAAMLQKLHYIYPYHQAIGFYLSAGYKSSLLDLLRRFPMEFDFYLTHQMKEAEYVKSWRLYVPKDF